MRITKSASHQSRLDWLIRVPGGNERLADGDPVSDAFDVKGTTRGLIDVDDRAVKDDGALGDGIYNRPTSQESLDDCIAIPTEDAFDGAAHSCVAQKGGATGKYLFVCSLGMRMGADDSGDPPIEEAAHGDFLAGCFAVDIDEDDGRMLAHFGDLSLDSEEGVFERGLHEGAALDVDHANLAFGGFENDRAISNGAWWVIEWA